MIEYFASLQKRIHLLAFVLTLMLGTVWGNGKFYRERVPADVPYQRAVIRFEEGTETLILQSQYKTAGITEMDSLAWVVPVPSVPELASMSADEANNLFFLLSIFSQPTVIYTALIAFTVIITAMVLFIYFRYITRFFKLLHKSGINPLIVNLLHITAATFIVVLAIIFLTPIMGSTGVDLLNAETVGIYDVKVIKGENAGAVTQWLSDNGFGFNEKDSRVFEQYVKKGWCFVAAKIRGDADPNSTETVSEGLAAPLILRFAAKEAVYPMALTGTTQSDTTILLYVFSDHKMDCEQRLILTYFHKKSRNLPLSPKDSTTLDPAGFFDDVYGKTWKMSKFKETLTPEQMQDDLIFRQAKNDKTYREVIWR